MIESMFGAASSPWPTVSSPGFGWSVPPRPLANGVGVAMTPRVAPELFSVAPIPAALPPDLFAGYGVPALLGAVAIRRGQPLGPTNDQEIEDFVYDAFEMLPGTNEVEVRCEGGRITLTGSVQHKRIKRDVGEIAWGIPIVNDVQNNVTIATKRRARPSQREGEPPQSQSGRKQG
jgi:hypothetical protein